MPSRGEDLVVFGSLLMFDPPNISIGQYLLDCMKKHGSQITLVNADTGYQQTFDELRLLSIRTALEMRARGVGKGDVVAFNSTNYLLTQLPFLATLYLGAKCLPIQSTRSTNELKKMLEIGGPKMIFCDEDFEMKTKSVIDELNLTNQTEIINFDHDFGKFIEQKHKEDDFEAVDVDNTDIALLPGTSGTSGSIKLVPLTYRTYFISVYTLCKEYLKDSCDDTLLSYAPLSWISGIVLISKSIMSGVKRLIAKPNPNTMIKMMYEYKVTVIISYVNQIMDMITHPDFKKYNVSSQIRQIFYSGVPATIDQTKLFRQTFPNAWCINGYGSTEIVLPYAFFYDTDPLNAEKHNSCGKLFNGMQGKIKDPENGTILGRNQLGEILLKSPYIMTGYWKDPESTRDVIDSDGWFHTGDLGYFDDDDCLFCTGRLKETFKCKRLQISPREIESIIQDCPGVQSVCVVGKKDPVYSNVPVAFIIKQKGFEHLTESDVYKFTEGKLTDSQKLRGGVRFVTSFPLSAYGKIKRFELLKIVDNEQ